MYSDNNKYKDKETEFDEDHTLLSENQLNQM